MYFPHLGCGAQGCKGGGMRETSSSIFRVDKQMSNSESADSLGQGAHKSALMFLAVHSIASENEIYPKLQKPNK